MPDRIRVHIDFTGYQTPPPPAPRCARERERLERRLHRVGRHLEASRGPGMNLMWLHWLGEWTTIHDALCGENCENCAHCGEARDA